MRTGDTFIREHLTKGRKRPLFRQTIGLAAGAFFLAACSSDGPPPGQTGHVEGNFGGVVSDEPRASLIGRDILSAGGTAADAAVAMYFALAVTYPGAATLGGEGVCVVHGSGRKGGIEAIDFRPLLIRRGGATIAIPGTVRAMAALHARYGTLPWGRVVNPAERLARFGNQVSRAFATQLAAVPVGEMGDAEMQRIFAPDGAVLREGRMLRQAELATALAAIRFRGAGDFYSGELAKRIADGLSANAGVPVTVSDIRTYRPVWLKTSKTGVGNHELHVAEGAKGARSLAEWSRMVRDAAPSGSVPGPAGAGESTGFAAIDRDSGGVACTVGAYDALRNGRVIGDTGILQAGPRPAGAEYPGLPMLLINVPRKDIIGAVVGAGSPAGETRALQAGVVAFDKKRDLPEGLDELPPAPGARANLIYCPNGITADTHLCRYVIERGTHGLAVSAPVEE